LRATPETSKNILSEPAARLTLTMSALFCANGASTPFLPRWLDEDRGLSGIEIGAVVAGAQLVRIVIGPVVAAWADGFRDRRTPIRILTIAGFCLYALFSVSSGFVALFALALAAGSFIQALTPLVEGATLRASQTGRIPFGVARGIGSGAFILGNVGCGALIGLHGPWMVIAWLLASLALAAAAAWLLEPDASPPSAATLGFRGRLARGAELMREPRFLRIVVGAGFIQAAHAFYYSFSVLVWRGQGIAVSTTGVLWAFGVAVEIVFLAMLPFVEKRTSPETLLFLGGAGAALRWSAMALAPSEFLLWPLQALHTLSFAATHVGALRLVFREAPEEVAGLAQTLYAALAGGVLIGAATLVSGVLYDRFGAGGYWAMAVLAALGLWIVAPLRSAR
jgi:PPP family 3-phenylpropionic acid transporter